MAFLAPLGIKLNDSKTEKGHALALLGVFGEFHGPRNDMSLTISLPKAQSVASSLNLRDFITRWTIHREKLAIVIAKLSFAQTSIFGRVCRAMMTSLYQKINAPLYSPDLSDREASAVPWRAIALLNLTPRLTRRRGPITDVIIYTDAATTTQIIAAILIDQRTFRAGRILSAVFSLRAGPDGGASSRLLARFTASKCWKFAPSRSAPYRT